MKHPQFEIIDHATFFVHVATAGKLAQTEPALVHTISSRALSLRCLASRQIERDVAITESRFCLPHDISQDSIGLSNKPL